MHPVQTADVCWSIPFWEIGQARNSVSNFVSSNPSPMQLPVATITRGYLQAERPSHRAPLGAASSPNHLAGSPRS